MKSSRLEACIGYIRFTLINEGVEPEDFDSEFFERILECDVSVEDAINNYIEQNNLVKQDVSNLGVFSKYPGSRCRVNYFGLKDKEKLDSVDRMISAIRIAELFISPLDIPFSIEHLVALHKKLFSDIYPSAGVFRTKGASKRTEFVAPEYIETMLKDLFKKLEQTSFLTKLDEDDDSEDFLTELAYYMGELEAIHPFIDGNGRVTRFFISEIAEGAGYHISWSEADPDHLLEASIAAIDGDYQALVDLLEEITIALEED